MLYTVVSHILDKDKEPYLSVAQDFHTRELAFSKAAETAAYIAASMERGLHDEGIVTIHIH